MSIEHIRLSGKSKDQLIKLKRYTGIKNWNTLCRWAFCLSLAEDSVPAAADIPTDSNVEMTWNTFGGRDCDIYMALLRQRCHEDRLPLDDETLNLQFRLHLHRGVGYLSGDQTVRSLSALVEVASKRRH